jgi:hypothetical protein
MIRIKEDQVAALVVALVAAIYWYDIRQLATLRSDDAVGPTGFPTVIAISAFLLCGILFARPQDDLEPIEHVRTALWYWLLLFLYVVAIPYAGFGLATAVFLAATLYCLGIKWRPLATAVVLITVTTLVLFNHVFGLKLTIGPWG